MKRNLLSLSLLLVLMAFAATTLAAPPNKTQRQEQPAPVSKKYDVTCSRTTCPDWGKPDGWCPASRYPVEVKNTSGVPLPKGTLITYTLKYKDGTKGVLKFWLGKSVGMGGSTGQLPGSNSKYTCTATATTNPSEKAPPAPVPN